MYATRTYFVYVVEVIANNASGKQFSTQNVFSTVNSSM